MENSRVASPREVAAPKTWGCDSHARQPSKIKPKKRQASHRKSLAVQIKVWVAEGTSYVRKEHGNFPWAKSRIRGKEKKTTQHGWNREERDEVAGEHWRNREL